MNFEPTDEQRVAVEALRRFAESEVRPVAERYAETVIPKDEMCRLLAGLAPFGFATGWLPVDAGGMGLDLVTSGLLYEELARVSPDIAGTAFINEGVALTIHLFGTPAQRKRYLPGLVAGTLVGCSAITEPGVGSNVRAVKTRATPIDGGFVIQGEKNWISNGGISDFAVVVARDVGAGADTISFFVVERAHGYTSRDLPKLGLNAWSTAQLAFDGVKIPADSRLGAAGVGLRETLKLFERARAYVAILAVAIARSALDAAIAYARDREQWGKAIAGHQMVQAMIAEMATELACARLLAYQGLSLLQRGVRCDTETSMAKWWATEAAVRIASRAVQVHGAYGLSREFPIERHFRNARMLTVPDGTTEIQKLIIARNLLGIAAFGESKPSRS